MNPVTDSSFKEQTSAGLVLVDFAAEWCAPCKVLGPLLDDISSKYPSVVFVKADIDSNSDSASVHRVRSVPTLIMLKDGTEVARQVGLLKKQDLIDWIDSAVDQK